MSKVLVIHGPNLDILGKREPSIYGNVTIDDINQEVIKKGKEKGISIETFQSNHEGDIVAKIGQASKSGIDAIIINPAAYTHTSIAIRDAISASSVPTVEVHLSNIYAREEFRHISMIAGVAKGQISGFGKMSYMLALEAVYGILNK